MYKNQIKNNWLLEKSFNKSREKRENSKRERESK